MRTKNDDEKLVRDGKFFAKTLVEIDINTDLLHLMVDKAEEQGKPIDKWVTEAICEKLFK